MMDTIFRNPAEHYDRAYFERQYRHEELGAKLNRFLFDDVFRSNDCVIDFGCGGGSMLKELGVRRAIGVDINPIAAAAAQEKGVEVHLRLDEITNGIADLIISNHALEHVENPLGEIRKMHSKLKPGGMLVIVVPCDRASYAYRENDPDFHLFSWSASNIAHLARCANFEVLDAREVKHRFPPRWDVMYRLLGLSALRAVCRLVGQLPGPRLNVRLLARKLIRLPTEVDARKD
jgi:SAM-dependent methyltransferase